MRNAWLKNGSKQYVEEQRRNKRRVFQAVEVLKEIARKKIKIILREEGKVLQNTNQRKLRRMIRENKEKKVVEKIRQKPPVCLTILHPQDIHPLPWASSHHFQRNNLTLVDSQQ